MQSSQPFSCLSCTIWTLELTSVAEPLSHTALAGSSLQHQFLDFPSVKGNKDSTLAIRSVETADSHHGINTTYFYLLKY